LNETEAEDPIGRENRQAGGCRFAVGVGEVLGDVFPEGPAYGGQVKGREITLQIDLKRVAPAIL
jgi:hypothetical protein